MAAPDYVNQTDANNDNAYLVTVRAFDGSVDTNQTVTINVTDVYETPPNSSTFDFELHRCPRPIAENQPVGTLVVQVTATDPHANATLSYRLANGPGSQHNDRFTLDANGSLRTATVLDYENRSRLKIRRAGG